MMEVRNAQKYGGTSCANATTLTTEGCKNTILRGRNKKIYAEENRKESVK
jgi:hypothetical protein